MAILYKLYYLDRNNKKVMKKLSEPVGFDNGLTINIKCVFIMHS